MVSLQQNIIYQGNSVITVETHPDYFQPVIIKKPFKRPTSRRSLRALEKEYELTRSLDAVDGARSSDHGGHYRGPVQRDPSRADHWPRHSLRVHRINCQLVLVI